MAVLLNFQFGTFLADILALACPLPGGQGGTGQGGTGQCRVGSGWDGLGMGPCSTPGRTGEGFPSHSVHLSLRIRPAVGVRVNLERYKLITGGQSCGVDPP